MSSRLGLSLAVFGAAMLAATPGPYELRYQERADPIEPDYPRLGPWSSPGKRKVKANPKRKSARKRQRKARAITRRSQP